MTLSARIHDAAVLNDIRTELHFALSVALARCAHHATDLTELDPDAIMAALRAQFDPTVATASIQDCFTNAFHAAHAEVDVAGVTDRGTLPSGCAL